jgi:hypothetical protein
VKRALIRKTVTIGALAAAAALAAPAGASPSPGGESPPFNLEVILRDVTDGSGFGHVKFRQPIDADKIVYLDTWVRSLAPGRSYLLQRAVDAALDGECTSAAWLTLGKGLEPQAITTDERGTGREQLFRDLTAVPTGTRFDIHFQVIDAETGAPVLASGCYRFAVRGGHDG